MNLNYLETYIEVVRSKSLTKAAKKLYLSQPAVSFQLKQLERELKFRLIKRDKMDFALTGEGEKFFCFAVYACREHASLLDDFSKTNHGVIGTLKIISSPIIGEFFLSAILGEFKEQKPFLDIRTEIGGSRKVFKTILKSTDMVGFCAMVTEEKEIETITIGQDEQVLVVYPGHPFSAKKEIRVSDLIGESVILRRALVGRRQSFRVLLKKAGLDLDHYQPKLILGTTTGVLAAVESKLGIAPKDVALKVIQFLNQQGIIS